MKKSGSSDPLFVLFYAFGFSQFERGIRAKTTKPPAMRVVSKKCYTK